MISQNQRDIEPKKDEFKRVKANLMLRTADITGGAIGASVYNSVGSYDNVGARVSWNMNWKSLLGNNYDRYSVFAIRLNLFMENAANWSNAAGIANQLASLQVSGLNWINNGYNSATQTNSGRCVLGIASMPNVANQNIQFPNDTAIAYFSRPGQYDPITIEMFQLISNSYCVNTVGAGLPMYACLFDIYPVY